jgi:hypothetical protein
MHSIESATASVVFAELLTDVLWRKMVRESEATANALGLTEKTGVSSFQFTIGGQQGVEPYQSDRNRRLLRQFASLDHYSTTKLNSGSLLKCFRLES